MNHLQINFHLPDLVITEIYRHLHQFFQTELNQEYHQTWKLGPVRIYLRHRARPEALISFDNKFLLNYRVGSAQKLINNFKKDEQFITRVPKNYWYTSGKDRLIGHIDYLEPISQ